MMDVKPKHALECFKSLIEKWGPLQEALAEFLKLVDREDVWAKLGPGGHLLVPADELPRPDASMMSWFTVLLASCGWSLTPHAACPQFPKGYWKVGVSTNAWFVPRFPHELMKQEKE